MKGILGIFNDGSVLKGTVKRTLIKFGRVMPGLPGFVQKGDGTVRCMICGKKLPDELSSARHIGPECIKRFGSIPGCEWIEPFAKAFKKYQRKQVKLGLPVMAFAAWHEKGGIV